VSRKPSATLIRVSRRSILLVLTLLLLAVLVSAGLTVFVVMSGGAPAPIPSNATLYLKLAAPWSEVESNDVFSQLLSRQRTLRSTIEAIRNAKADARVKTLVIVPQSAGALWAQLQEVRAALDDFRASGKPITAFLEYGGAGEYYLASAADRIVLMPAGQLDVTGLAFYEVFFRSALDKIGVYPDLLHIGEYKTASNTFTEKSFTAAHREMTRSLNRDWYDELVRGIAKGRKISEDAARAAMDKGPYLAADALKAGLVDELAYEDQLDDKAPIQGTRRLDGDQYFDRATTPYQPGADRIALIYAVGTITSGKSGDGAGTVLGSESFAEWMRRVRGDSTIRAVVVRVDSPGGSAIASEVMWRELKLTQDVKPVVVSMGDVAASGGYYIAAPADTIVAQPGTLTGSIGVVTGKYVLQGTLDKIGVGTGTVSEGRFADIYSPFKPFTPDERARIEEQMQATYELFLARVAEGRHQTAAKIDAVAKGRVWTGRQAREVGLVDELGGLDDAIRIAKQRAKLDVRKGTELVVYPQKRSIYEVLANPFGTSTRMGVSDLLGSYADVRAVEAAAATLRLFRRGEPLAIMPSILVK